MVQSNRLVKQVSFAHPFLTLITLMPLRQSDTDRHEYELFHFIVDNGVVIQRHHSDFNFVPFSGIEKMHKFTYTVSADRITFICDLFVINIRPVIDHFNLWSLQREHIYAVGHSVSPHLVTRWLYDSRAVPRLHPHRWMVARVMGWNVLRRVSRTKRHVERGLHQKPKLQKPMPLPRMLQVSLSYFHPSSVWQSGCVSVVPEYATISARRSASSYMQKQLRQVDVSPNLSVTL